MKKDSPSGIGFFEGRAYTIGREGHIRIDDLTLSRGHAEIKFIDGKMRLRDLGSTNGTYLVDGNKLVGISESFVLPEQRVIVGNGHYKVKDLLAMAGVYVSYSDKSGLIVKLSDSANKPPKETDDLDEQVSHAINQLFE